MRRNLKTIFLLLAIMAAMCMFVGCGNGRPDDSKADSETQESNTEDGQGRAEQDQFEEEASGKPIGASGGDASDTSADGSDELCVFVESIGENSVVGNIVSMESGTDGTDIVVMIGEEGGNKKLISIYFTDDASYVYQIIRNGDVETREGSFSDIGINMILDLTGYYKGEDFYADKVAISDVKTN